MRMKTKRDRDREGGIRSNSEMELFKSPAGKREALQGIGGKGVVQVDKSIADEILEECNGTHKR